MDEVFKRYHGRKKRYLVLIGPKNNNIMEEKRGNVVL